jgi:hypothetical protein
LQGGFDLGAPPLTIFCFFCQFFILCAKLAAAARGKPQASSLSMLRHAIDL